jgi:hypothetical protein
VGVLAESRGTSFPSLLQPLGMGLLKVRYILALLTPRAALHA